MKKPYTMGCLNRLLTGRAVLFLLVFLNEQGSVRPTYLWDRDASSEVRDVVVDGGVVADYVLHLDVDHMSTLSYYTSKTIATLQVVTNPVLNSKTSPIASTLFQNLHDLQADLVRYAGWYPYPPITVAELDPPNATSRTTSWNFTAEFQQQFMDIFRAVTNTTPTVPMEGSNLAVRGRRTPQHQDGGSSNRLLFSFSTQPTWMFNTTDWSYDTQNPNKAIWNYPRGAWTNRTTQLVGDYYGRLVSWLVNGSLEDEFGNIVSGGPALGLGPGGVTHWEVFNEPEAEHRLDWQAYNKLFDSVVQSIRKSADPTHQITFVGMALSGHYEWDWYEGFLTLDNHASDVRDAVANGMISFHWYGNIGSRTDVSKFDVTFGQLQHFLDTEIDHIIALRDRLSPSTRLFLNEAGVIPNDDNNPNADPLPPIYYNMAAGVYTVLVSELSTRGIDAVGSSQFCGCPPIPEWDIPNPQYPGVSMTNWTTGNGNPRYWALRLYLQYFGPGDKIFLNGTRIVSSAPDEDNSIYAQARFTEKGRNYAVILVNKTARRQALKLDAGDFTKAQVNVVDETTHDEKWKEFTIPFSGCCSHNHTLVLEPFAVAVLNLIKSTQDLSVQNASIGESAMIT